MFLVILLYIMRFLPFFLNKRIDYVCQNLLKTKNHFAR